MIVAPLCFVAFYPGGGHIGFRHYGGPRGRPSWRPSKIEKSMVWAIYVPNLVLWKNLNQKSPTAPTITKKLLFLVGGRVH